MEEIAARGRRASWLGLVECLLSLAAVALAFLFPLAYIGAHLCAFGECSEPGPDDIAAYRVLVGIFAAVVVATFAIAARRGAGWAFAWHSLVAILGALSAVVFWMPTIDWAELLREDPPPPNRDYVPCHSGPPNDCPGG